MATVPCPSRPSAAVVMVGVFAGLTSVVSPQALEKAVGESVPQTTRELNLTAYRRGLEYVRGAS